MNEIQMVTRRKKKASKSQKSKSVRGKVKHIAHKRKTHVTHEFEENEKEVMALLENSSLISESSNNETREEDNKSPSERFFCGTPMTADEELESVSARRNTSGGISPFGEGEEEADVSSGGDPEEIISKQSTDDLSTTTRSGQQPTLASTFIQIDDETMESLIKLVSNDFIGNFEDLCYKPNVEAETSLLTYSKGSSLNSNVNLMINRLYMEAKYRRTKVNMDMVKVLKNSQKYVKLFYDIGLCTTLCDFKFKPIFMEPSWDSMDIPSKKLIKLHIKDLRFTEHPELQEEHRLANNLELIYEHRNQRLKEKITEKLYADLQVERNVLNDLLKNEENSGRTNSLAIEEQQKKALAIEQRMFKVKALREKLYGEENTNKQLLQDILENWLKLKNLRKEQSHQYTRLKLRLKIEDLTVTEMRKRQKLWSQRFDTDLNEIYREKLEEYYRCKRLWRLERNAGEDILARPRKPNVGQLSSQLRDEFERCFANPKEPRIDVIRVLDNDEDLAIAPGPKKLHSYYMRVFFDGQMVGETRCYRLERDLSFKINENLGIVLNRRLPKDIKIKLYKKSKISSSQKIANIIVPLPLSSPMTMEAQSFTITFSSHKQPISGYLRLDLESDDQLYPPEIVKKLFPAPKQHTHIPKHIMREWYQRKLLPPLPSNTSQLDGHYDHQSALSCSETEEELEQGPLSQTCIFHEDLLRFCDISEVENNPRLRVLRSRYAKNDARTRDLKFVRMLDHELEFDWETEECVIDPGNWMDPIDLHKHEGKKYLKNLYESIQNQCNRLNKMVASHENLLLYDEPMSWSALFNAIRLIFQPHLASRNLHQPLSSPTSTQNFSLDCPQNFKIVCNIIRATGIPVRITNPDDTDSKGRSSPESTNVFLLQNLKYSNVRSFIAISYRDKFCRTMTAEGSNPTWNEQLILNLSLADLRDDFKICLFDEVVENQWNDDSSLRNADIFQRIQNNWLGEYRIPINAILAQQKIDGVFELNIPKILLGYKRPSLDNISGNIDTNIVIEQFPEIKESVRLWCYLSVEPSIELPTINTKSLECSELIEMRYYLNDWRVEAMEMYTEKFLDPLISTAEGKRVCITRLLQALPLPIEASENLLDSACRYTSMLATTKSYNPCQKFEGIWLNNELLLEISWGSPKDLGVLLCNYLLHLGLQCWLVLGIAYDHGECSYVLYSSDEEMLFIDPCSGKRYSVKDVFCPLYKIHMVVSTNNFYLNIQSEPRVTMMSFNFNDSSCWLPGFSKRNPAPLGGFQSPSYKYRPSFSILELRHNIERKIMKKISAWRTMRKTIWNRAFQPRLLNILQGMEQSVTYGGGSSYEELKYNNMLAAEFPNYKIYGFTLNYSYTNLNQISERIKSTGIHLNSSKNVEFSLAVHIHTYPNNILSIWILLISVVINK
ncbi:coiled-coil and C2 domain containing 2A isoform X2 [Haematobia irritans]|uniref:coiled-coil and C2 domain containing 2A isoform X2 n=1 Tax=Haematobia irritans TaxID=7368 RepID=UPI003F4FF35B